jgi:hypothetical protein
MLQHVTTQSLEFYEESALALNEVDEGFWTYDD